VFNTSLRYCISSWGNAATTILAPIMTQKKSCENYYK